MYNQDISLPGHEWYLRPCPEYNEQQSESPENIQFYQKLLFINFIFFLNDKLTTWKHLPKKVIVIVNNIV